MTFTEAMEELLKGKKVRRVKWAVKEDYITLATSGYIVWNNSSKFNPNTDDITGVWEEYYSLKPGSRFVKDGKIYRLVSVTSSRVSASPSMWSLINVDGWYSIYGELTTTDLIDMIRDGELK